MQHLPDQATQEALSKEISDLTLKVCTPLYWHDRTLKFPKEVEGASCFVMRFGNRYIGITANHVVQLYKKAKQNTPNLVSQLRLTEFDLDKALIDQDQDLDIATFGLSEEEVQKINITPVDCTGSWPPPEPKDGYPISFAGFPEEIRRIVPEERAGEFNAFGGLGMIDSLSEKEILTSFDPKNAKAIAGRPLPPLGFNKSGCSGGPVLMHANRNGLHRWFPVAMIIAGSAGAAKGENTEFDMMRCQRVQFVNEEGSITRPSTGWLPK